MSRSRRRRGSNMPGVSTSMICASPSKATPSKRVRVVCVLGEVMATFCPTSAFTSVDLPALGAPTTATSPQRCIIPIPPTFCAPPLFRLLALSYPPQSLDRKSVVLGKSVSVRVDLGGHRILKKKTKRKLIPTTYKNHEQ